MIATCGLCGRRVSIADVDASNVCVICYKERDRIMTRVEELQGLCKRNGFCFAVTRVKGFSKFWFYDGVKPGFLNKDSVANVMGIQRAEVYAMGRIHGGESNANV